jgi:uncharacterized membrane protein
MPMRGRLAFLSMVMFQNLNARQGALLACVASVDLAIYNHSFLTRVVLKQLARIVGINLFIRFNPRRQI